MAHLGDFSAAERELSAEADTIGFLGETLTLRKSVDGYVVIDFVELATSDKEAADPKIVGQIDRVIRSSLTEDSYTRYRELVAEHGVDLPDILRFSMMLFQAAVGRPTKRPTGSSGGPGGTSTNASDSFSQALERLNLAGS